MRFKLIESFDNIDSEGNVLSNEQIKYFSQSKIRDDNGNLLVCYHGSPNTGFTVFDINKSRNSGLLGKGFYFTNTKSHASTYGNPYEVYLNIIHPLIHGPKDITENQILAFLKAVQENENYGLDNYGYGATPESVLSKVSKADDFAILFDINNSCIGDFVAAIKLFNTVCGTTYDGIVTDVEMVVFYPNQIKSIENKNPTNSDDINEEMKFELLTEAEFIKYNANSAGNDEPDCTARALSLSLNIPYDEVRKEMEVIRKEAGYSNFHNKTTANTFLQNHTSSPINTASDRITVQEFADTHPEGKYFLTTMPKRHTAVMHAVCIMDGNIYDSWDSREAVVLEWCQTDATKSTLGTVKDHLDELYSFIEEAVQKIWNNYKLDEKENYSLSLRKQKDNSWISVSNDFSICETITLTDERIKVQIGKIRNFESDRLIYVFTPTTKYEDAKQQIISTIEEKTTNIFDKLVSTLAVFRERGDAVDAGGYVPFRMNKQEEALYNWLPTDVKNKLTGLRISHLGQDYCSVQVEMKPMGWDTKTNPRGGVIFSWYTVQPVKDMIMRYLNKHEIPRKDYDPYDEYKAPRT